jgi:hypothetical protein
VAGHQFERQAGNVIHAKGKAHCAQCDHEAQRQRVLGMASERGGVCLEGDYLGYHVPHRMRCQHGHEWQALGYNLLKGCWCPTCAAKATGIRRGINGWRLKDLQDMAVAREGRCVSTTYQGYDARYEMVCASGHRWTSTVANIVSGAWCKRCAQIAHGEQQMHPEGMSRLQAAAQAKGGTCLDSEYRGVVARYRFRCDAGHVWKTVGAKILEGFWCPACNLERQRLGIEAMRAIAHERGGRCLSEQYVNARQRLQWECGHGHVWWTSPMAIRRGCWCPSCAILNRIRTRGQRKRLRYERAPGLD